MPRSSPPAPEKRETAEPTIMRPVWPLRVGRARTLAGVRRPSWTPLVRSSWCSVVTHLVHPDPVTVNGRPERQGEGVVAPDGGRTVNLGGGRIVPYPEPRDEAA